MCKTIGIISIILSVFVGFQSMIAGLGNTLSQNNEIGGSTGFLLSILLLIAGITVLASKGAKGMLIFSMLLYAIGGLLGFVGAGSYSDLVIWSVISLLFAVLLLLQIRKIH